MKWLVLIGIVCVLALLGLGGDDSDQTLPPVAVHNSAHDCSQDLAQQFLFGAASMIFGSSDLHKVIATDGTRVVVCMDLDGDGICEPRTIFSCRNAPTYVARDAARNGLQPLSPEDVKGVLHWPEIAMAALLGVVIVAAMMPQRKVA